MSVYATIIVTNTNQLAAQNLTSPEMFTTLLKKGIRKYWVSSGFFPQDYYDALVNSNLIFGIETNKSVRPSATILELGMTKVIIED